jgi:hypothetical protein
MRPQLLRARQEAADDAQRRAALLQARLERAEDSAQRMAAEAEAAQTVAAVRGAELEEAARQLAAAVEGAARTEESHRQVRQWHELVCVWWIHP